MKTLISLLLSLALLMCAPLALAEDDRTLTVSGASTVTLAPDSVELTMGVSATAATVGEAREASAASMQKLLDALLALGVAREDVQTSDFTVNPQYDYSTDRPALYGYEVSNMIRVRIRDLTQLSAVLDGTLTDGADHMYGLRFTSSQEGMAYDQAMQQAVAEAARKAGLLAEAGGVTLGEVLHIREGNGQGFVPVYREMTNAAKDSTTPIEAGQLTVSATVELVYAIR